MHSSARWACPFNTATPSHLLPFQGLLRRGTPSPRPPPPLSPGVLFPAHHRFQGPQPAGSQGPKQGGSGQWVSPYLGGRDALLWWVEEEAPEQVQGLGRGVGQHLLQGHGRLLLEGDLVVVGQLSDLLEGKGAHQGWRPPRQPLQESVFDSCHPPAVTHSQIPHPPALLAPHHS